MGWQQYIGSQVRGSACSDPPCRAPRQVSSPFQRSEEQHANPQNRRWVPRSQAQPQGLFNAGLAASLLRAFLAKATWKAGEAGWGDDAEGWGSRAR